MCAWNYYYTVNAVFCSTIVVTLERNVFSSNYNSKINIRNVKGRRDGMPKQKVCNKVGMMHESKGQLIGKLSPIPTSFFTLQLDSMLERYRLISPTKNKFVSFRLRNK